MGKGDRRDVTLGRKERHHAGDMTLMKYANVRD